MTLSSDLFYLPELQPTARPLALEGDDRYGDHSVSHTPIVIDNGSTSFRYGWATSTEPCVAPNLVAKYRDKRNNVPFLLFGDAVDIDPQARAVAKSPWEGDHLNSFEALEAAFDFAFLDLGINNPTVDHPIIMTERLSTLSYSRATTSEMLFELYSVPRVTYAIDALMSFAHNHATVPLGERDGLVLSFNTSSTSVIPVLNGRGVLSKTKRLPFGGHQASQYLVKLLQLKHPNFPAQNHLALPQSGSWMYQKFSEFSLDYTDTLRSLKDPASMTQANRVVQFPFSAALEKVKTEEELAGQTERRKESGRRLQEEVARKRVEKLLQKQTDLDELIALREWKDKEDPEDYIVRLENADIESEKSLNDIIKKLETELRKAKLREAGEDDVTEEPTFPLVDVPDDQLDEDGIKEKRRQKLMKSLYDGRVRQREERAKEKAGAEEEARLEALERESNFEGWSSRWRQEHERVMLKMREREKRKAELADRKSAASQNRLRNIANLAADQPIVRKRRRKGDDDDGFGRNDADFDVYRDIGGGDGLSEEEDLTRLANIENRLLTHDQTFSTSHTYASLSTRKPPLLRAFCPAYDAETSDDMASKHQMTLNVERWKVPEAWYCPTMAGVDCAGLGEILANTLAAFSERERIRMAKNVFLTGGPVLIPHLSERIFSTIQPVLPPGTTISVQRASDPLLDAWRGMASVARDSRFDSPEFGVISKADYEEYGADRIRRWWGGNANYTI
ncbi:Nuclear actin-protein involved in chromatin remodeling [Tulasnella sp. JGI-2019a]|nr:Nuclear actin-protein involved in chromatin remodeling [Tulasnella sp. JGI-2019a]